MNRALLCETVIGPTMAELIAARDRAVGDMVELRLDQVEQPDVAAALAGRTKPVVVTCRPTWEGGHFDGSEEARHALLREALERGAEFVDIEWRAGFADLLRDFSPRIVLSSHDFNGVPVDLRERTRAMRQSGAAIVKIAVMVNRLTETLPLREIARQGAAVVIGMGEAGVATRLLASHFGSRWTYGGQVAPGQLAAADMANEFRFTGISSSTAVYGVVGNNVLRSLSPVMHNAAFAAAGLDAVYVPLRAADFDDFLGFAAALGIAGASVTIPFKRDALAAADAADALTRATGAANTVRRDADRWIATNTDIAGFLAPLEPHYREGMRGVRASVLGAGGAARAVVVALNAQGARVTVHARRVEQARELAAEFRVDAAEWPPMPGSWDLLVNTTPIGGAPARDVSPLPDGPFDGRVVYDLTYGATPSRLVTDAAAAGCVAIDGLPMLIAQAERQFAWWTGQQPAAGVMARAATGKIAGLAAAAREQADRVGAV